MVRANSSDLVEAAYMDIRSKEKYTLVTPPQERGEAMRLSKSCI